MHDSPCNIRVKWVNVYDCDDTCAYMHPVLNICVYIGYNVV